jgi:2-polyprenyl-6-methoxyphenol hydroxylase-like FAD-dependent oxidoreductase
MARVVVVGGGFAGLTASILLARHGHQVVVIERDAPPDGDTADQDFEGWSRPGAPQARQSHVMLACARRVLLDEAPDVVEALLARGVHEQAADVGAGHVPGEAMLQSRRLVAEAVLRRIAEREPRVTIRSGEAVVGLSVAGRPASPVPVVAGVRTRDGDRVPGDLVVDAGGRRSALPTWLGELGCRPAPEEAHDCGFFYLTRFYRLRPGCERPTFPVPSAINLGYATALAFGADNGVFSLSLTLSVHDPHRQALREPARHAAFMGSIPRTAGYLGVAEPISDISMMARIENRRRRLVDADGPVVGGLVVLGDAALHTNPTLGRGISLAMMHARHLAAAADSVGDDPTAFVAGFEAWTSEHLGGWFDSQVTADQASLARLEASVRGEHLPPSTDPMVRFGQAAFALAATDPVVGAAVARMVHLLATPAKALGDPEVASRVTAFLATDPDLDQPIAGPTRADFERIATA